MRLRAKVDSNQSQIVEALRAVGATVQLLHQVGGGVPDLLVGFRQQNFLLEVKDGRGSLTPDQTRWHSTWRGGQARVVRSVDEALEAIGAVVS